MPEPAGSADRVMPTEAQRAVHAISLGAVLGVILALAGRARRASR